ncbi:hypothetical protein ABN028_24705 [Actinopolymorpha sp. B17G11]|uniref:hypothetical protein n=1 Tax=Actinopolymorpha sp. B17G11 TaxID=3160861 RepID=UPI0032E5159C
MAFRSRPNRASMVEVFKPRLHEKWWVQLLLVIWRWWIEFTIVAALIWAYLQLVDDMPSWAAVCVMIAPVTAGLCVPVTGRLIRGWTWCLITRHRVRSFMTENGIRNRSGKLPWILATYPTPVGERVWLLLIAGMSVDDIKDRTSALASTCWAADARLDRTRRSAAVLRIDIIRRDPLGTKKPLKSTLVDTTGNGNAPAEHVVTVGLSARKTVPSWVVDTPATEQPTAVPAAAESTSRVRAVKPAKPAVAQTSANGSTVMANGEDISDYV